MTAEVRASTRGRLLELASEMIKERGEADPLGRPLLAAGLACISVNDFLKGVTSEAERLLPASATPLERGIMMGAAITLALVGKIDR